MSIIYLVALKIKEGHLTALVCVSSLAHWKREFAVGTLWLIRIMAIVCLLLAVGSMRVKVAANLVD